MAYQDERTPVQRPAAQRPQGSVQRPAARPTGTARPASARPAAQRPQGSAQRPAARSTAARPAQRPAGAARPSGARPQQKARKKTVQPKFFIFLAILLVVIIAAVVGIVKLVGGSGTPDVQSSNPAQNAVTATADEGDTLTAEDYQQLAEQLESEDGVAVLDDSQRVDVADLAVTKGLSEDWINVLLLGTDEREVTDKGRTDAMIICSVNKNTGEVKLASIQRDLAINFADLGYEKLGMQRVNSANFYGGPELAMKTVNQLFGMNIEHYALVNFFGFQDAVNALGGITLDITENEMNKINVAQKQVAGVAVAGGMDISTWDNEELTTFGPDTRLNGQQALGYARIRKLDSDYARSERQRKVLMAMLEEAKTKSTTEILQLGVTLMPYISTNLDLNEIMNVALVVLANDMEIDSMRLPINGTYLQEKRNGQDMLWDCDFVQNTQELYRFIYNN